MKFKDFFKKKPSYVVQILRGSLWGVCLSYLGFVYVQNIADQEFTATEKQGLKQIFKDSVNIDDIVFHRSAKGNNILSLLGADGAQLGDTIIINTRYDRQSPGYKYTLDHEAAHIWQNQNCTFSLVNNFVDEVSSFNETALEKYQYRLDETKDLLDYHHEKQASIIADYFNRRVGKHQGLLLNEGLTQHEEDALYKAVLKNFLEDPRYINKACPLNISLS
tara:strand:- start:241366 stop:242025 length:660 start_codon:yes stop_codon:yes gene_type:complete